MMKVGDRVPLELGGEAEITQLLGQGGQGAVYRASYRGRDYALKMYFTKKLKIPQCSARTSSDCARTAVLPRRS